MQYVKLQIGCLLVILYIIVSYNRASYKTKIQCNKLFDALMICAPWAVFFDGLTAWTVNNRDIVPDVVNMSAHLLFFIFMDLTVLITTMYMYDQLVGFSESNKRRNLIFYTPWLISLIVVIVEIGNIRFIHGETTDYSMGASVYACFASLGFNYGAILLILIRRYRFLPKEKVVETLSFIAIVGITIAVQVFFPEVLISAIATTALVLGIYINFENPSIRKLTIHNNEMVDGFATMVENRDNNTGGHIKRTRAYVDLMLQKMQRDKHYFDIINKDYMTNVSSAAPLHDIGKIATPDSILRKPGRLTPEEFEIIKEHAVKGGDIIMETFDGIDNPEFKKIAYEVARHHHEKYNGRGYPDGLVGEQIPLHARIMAIADVFDAVSQKRCYRDALPADECFAIIERGAGSDFDPLLAKIFLGAKDEVMRLMESGVGATEESK